MVDSKNTLILSSFSTFLDAIAETARLAKTEQNPLLPLHRLGAQTEKTGKESTRNHRHNTPDNGQLCLIHPT